MTNAQRNALKKYQKKCKSKIVTFYPKEKDLLEVANSLNFQKFVKDALRFYQLKKDMLK